MSQYSHVVLYSGAHKGAEAEFGRNAERWGIEEVNYSFRGHKMERTRGAKTLTAEELKKGDISMEMVSQRMNRHNARAEKIRSVIQSLYHMVINSYQVFAIGWIQADDTVKGGTGWGVELAKIFNRPVSVYDQDRHQWFAWKDQHWVPDEPLIPHRGFAGTGTRHLTEAGRAAIEELFRHSFGPPPEEKA